MSLRQRLLDDRGSLPMVMLITLVGMMLSAMLVPMLLNQDHSTRFDVTRVQSVEAAQAGIDTALGQIRSATDATGAGDAATLPCTKTSPLSGSIYTGSGNAGLAVTYKVSIVYYTAGDTVMDRCFPGYGPYDSSTGTVTPAWAEITSTGYGGSGNGSSVGRKLITTYRFKTSNVNIAGGVVRIFPAGTTSSPMCLDAGATVPAAGTSVALQLCSSTTPPSAQQVFAYRTDLTLQLLASVTSANSNGLCLTYPSADNTNPTSGATVTLTACQELGNALWYQQWSFDDNGHFRASLSTSKNSPGTLSVLCMDVATQTAGTLAKLVTCAGGTSDARQAWIPAPSVGAGAAIAPTSGQWVNYYEFGRCLDVTGQDVNATFLIDYPCKQNPYPNAVAWNQKFSGPTIAAGGVSASGQIYTTVSGTQYCLTSPGTDNGSALVKPCSATNTLQTWTVYNDDNSLSYAMKFTVVDSKGLCLGLGTPQGGMVWSSISVEKCGGAGDQKWNAVPSTPSVTNTREVPAGS